MAKNHKITKSQIQFSKSKSKQKMSKYFIKPRKYVDNFYDVFVKLSMYKFNKIVFISFLKLSNHQIIKFIAN